MFRLWMVLVVLIIQIIKQIKSNMKEEDYQALKKWLVEHHYYVGNSDVAVALRKLADEWDD